MASVWIVGRGQAYWEEQFLCRHIEERGVDARYVPVEQLSVDRAGLRVATGETVTPTVLHVRSDAYTRLAPEEVPLFYDTLEMAEDLGSRLVNPSRATRRVRNKLRQVARLDRAGVPVPWTRAVHALDDVNATLRELGTAVVLKPPYGHASLDLMLVGAQAATVGPHEEIVLWHLLRRHGMMLAQQAIPAPFRELRVSVIGGRVAACFELRKTYQNAGLPLAVTQYERLPADLTAAVRDLAARTTAVLELDIALLDVADTAAGPLVIEANGSIAAWRDVHRDPQFDVTANGIGCRYGDHLVELAVSAGDAEQAHTVPETVTQALV